LRSPGDHRNSLVKVFADLVAGHRPHAFLFENVEGFLTGAKGRHVFDLLEPVIEAGYRVHVWKLNAANYGIPQHRKRVIAVGGLGWNPSLPKLTHSAYGAPGAHLAGRHLPKAPTVNEALHDLPPAVPRGETPNVLDHAYVPLSADDLRRARLLAPGQRMRDLPEEYWHNSYRRRAFRRVLDGTPTERRGGAPAGLRRLSGDEPSKAITGGALNEFLHPTHDRSLTTRECARLQTFPDDFKFLGSPTDVVQLIGNAVPPKLAFVLAKSLRDDLTAATLGDNQGALLSFVPTLATGMSPALETVTHEVRRRFRMFTGEYQLNLQWS
jgi:DNA (cytosine-5)-methyltransferase 1